MNLSHKVDLLDWLSRGQNVAFVGRYYGVNESTIRYKQKNKKAIQESVAASAVPSTKVVQDALTTWSLRSWMLLSPHMPRSSLRRSWEEFPRFPSKEEEYAGNDEEEKVLRSKLTVRFLGEILQEMRSVTERLLHTPNYLLARSANSVRQICVGHTMFNRQLVPNYPGGCRVPLGPYTPGKRLVLKTRDRDRKT